MDIEQARAIPLRRIFAVMGILPAPTLNGLDLYRSPFSPDRQSMLVVNPKRNTWIDPVSNEEGDTITLVSTYLRYEGLNYSVMDALRWLRNMVGQSFTPLTIPAIALSYAEADSLFQMKEDSYLSDPLLIRFAEESRGIPFAVAQKHFKEVSILNTCNGKSFVALGVENEDGGFVIRNSLQKAHIGKRAITFVRGKHHKPETIHLFKDMFDYLSAVLLRNDRMFNGDSIILNSYDCLNDMTAYIRLYGYRYFYSWLGNDTTGKEVTATVHEFCKTEPGLNHIPMNRHYSGYKDVNEWHLAESGKLQRKCSHGMPFGRFNEGGTG